MHQDRPSPAGQLPAIQMLRALAALAVVASHVLHEASMASKSLGLDFPSQTAASLIAGLPWIAGVDLFFVISGFVMVHASRELFGTSGAQSIFIRKRLARIVPLYWCLTAVYIALSFLGVAPLNREHPGAGEMLSSFLFIPFARPDGYIQPVFSLGWTLNYEIFFYMLFAFALPFVRRVAVPLLLMVLISLVIIGQFVPESAVQLHFWTRPIILEFGMGMMIGYWALGAKPVPRHMGIAALGMALALFALGHVRPDWMPADRAYLYGIPSAFLVFSALALPRLSPINPLGRILVKLGDASYALYLIHPFVLRGLSVLAGLALVRISPWLFVLAGLVLSSLVAWGAWKWFERPVTNALQGSRLLSVRK
jgi:exopolysaccharide production protein ExoZ